MKETTTPDNFQMQIRLVFNELRNREDGLPNSILLDLDRLYTLAQIFKEN